MIGELWYSADYCYYRPVTMALVGHNKFKREIYIKVKCSRFMCDLEGPWRTINQSINQFMQSSVYCATNISIWLVDWFCYSLSIHALQAMNVGINQFVLISYCVQLQRRKCAKRGVSAEAGTRSNRGGNRGPK